MADFSGGYLYRSGGTLLFQVYASLGLTVRLAEALGCDDLNDYAALRSAAMDRSGPSLRLGSRRAEELLLLGTFG